MRAQLRTYHAIPSLQAHQDPHAYKQLQDAPRLKSILKGGAEDRTEPSTLEGIKNHSLPRTNPVNLIFIMCASALKVAELHFPKGHEFHDLVMKTHYSSASRAKAFLWLMWFYLESDFTEEGCEENPFGPGVDYDLGVANQGIPVLEVMTEEEIKLENIDPQEEVDFGREKQKTRAKILEMDQAYLNDRESRRVKRLPFPEDGGGNPVILPRIKPSKHESDIDSTRSTPPPKGILARPVLGSSRRAAPLKYQIFEGSSPARQGTEGIPSRKPRPPTAHQLAVERNRHERVEYILEHGLRRQHHKSRKLRRQDGAIYRAYRRVQAEAEPLLDSDSDSAPPENLMMAHNQPFRERGIGGLGSLGEEEDDFGEGVYTYSAALRRSTRRLSRWLNRDPKLGAIAPVKRPKQNGDAEDKGEEGEEGEEGEDGERPNGKVNGATNGDVTVGDVTMDDVELDDMDQTALADDEGRPDEDMDDPDKTEVMGESDVD
jgi:Ino eighty subunit 1